MKDNTKDISRLIEELDANSQESAFDVQQIVNIVRANWIWAIACGLLALILAWLALRFSTPVYDTRAKILIKEESSGAGDANALILENLGITSQGGNVENEMQIINSYSLMQQVVEDLGLNVRFYSTNHRVKKGELYRSDLPFLLKQEIIDEKMYHRLLNDEFILSLDDNTIVIKNKTDEKEYRGSPGSSIVLPGVILTFFFDEEKPQLKYPLEIGLNSVTGTTNSYASRLSVTSPQGNNTIIDLKILDSKPRRSEDVLNTVISNYINNEIQDRNIISDSTIAFIDERLDNVTKELTGLESEIQQFKQENNIVNIETQSQAMVSSSANYGQSETDLEVQLSVVNSLMDFLRQTSSSPKLVPTSLTVTNPGLSSIIQEYNSLLLQRERSLMSVSEENPLIQNIDSQLATLRTSLNNGLQSMKQTLQASLNTLRRRSGNVQASIRNVPAQERRALEYSRQQQIQQELYIFLLQRREEVALSKSSTISHVRVIDAARTLSAPVKPKKSLIYMAALLLGLLAPFLIIYIRDLLNNKIKSKKDIERNTTAPILGEIGHYDQDDGRTFVVEENNDSPLAEQFRILRSNLRFTLQGQGNRTILITSTMPGEGKTFISMNLAATLAVGGKKTALLGMDLRRPQLTKLVSMEKKAGISGFLIRINEYEDILYPINKIPNLSIMPAGIIPPNPSELLMNEKTQELFQKLKADFDYVIIDCAPMTVTDANILAEYADATLFVTRVDATYKESIKQLDRLVQANRLPRIGLVVNDIRHDLTNSYYGYGYSRYYRYGYYHKEELTGWQKFKKQIKESIDKLRGKAVV